MQSEKRSETKTEPWGRAQFKMWTKEQQTKKDIEEKCLEKKEESQEGRQHRGRREFQGVLDGVGRQGS